MSDALKVTASCHTDDYKVEVKSFDATPWFDQAEDEELLALDEEGYGGDYSADGVAEFCSDLDEAVKEMFTYHDIVNAHRGSRDPMGFECYVDEKEARAWIRQNRPVVWKAIEQRDKGE